MAKQIVQSSEPRTNTTRLTTEFKSPLPLNITVLILALQEPSDHIPLSFLNKLDLDSVTLTSHTLELLLLADWDLEWLISTISSRPCLEIDR